MKKALQQLIAVVVIYSLVFILPRSFAATSSDAQCITALLLPLFVICVLVCIFRAGLAQLCGTALTKNRTSHCIKALLPYGLVLLVPLANAICAFISGVAEVTTPATFTILVYAALIEELVFRGYLMGILLARRLPPLNVVFTTATLFACLHLFNATTFTIAVVALQTITAFLVGLTFGLIRLTCNSIYPCMLVHVLVNITSSQALLYDGTCAWITCIAALIAGIWSLFWWKSHSRARA